MIEKKEDLAEELLKKAFNIHMLNCLNGAYAIFWSLILRVLPMLLVQKIGVIGYPFDG